MIWTQLICSNCITFRLNITLLIAQHTPFIDYTSLPLPWDLLDGFIQPFFSGIVMPLTDSQLCDFLANIEAPYPVEHNAACRCFLSTNFRLPKMNIWEFNAFFPQEPHGPSLPWKLPSILQLLSMHRDH